ncbi:DUF1223 domain-containing protein [Pseudomonadota bacterium]
MSIKCLVVFTALIFPVLSASAESVRFVSPDAQTSLIELYTSEGCSSCPPADRWLSNLRNSEKLWKEFVPLAFHVDYWDYIGWKDRFASPYYGVRQRLYAQHRDISTVYTPGIILNGKEWRDWYRYKQPTNTPGQNVGRLQLDLNREKLKAQFSPIQLSNDAPREKLNLHIAVLGFDIVTEVKAGENEDRRLQHDFVVLAHKVETLKRQQRFYQVETELPQADINSKTLAIAAWVSRHNHPKPLQAVGGWLP